MHGQKMEAVDGGYVNKVCSLIKTSGVWALQVGSITVGTATAAQWPSFAVAEPFGSGATWVVEVKLSPKPKARPASRDPEETQPAKRTAAASSVPEPQPAKATAAKSIVPTKKTAAKSSAPNKIAVQNEQAAPCTPLDQPTSAGIQVLCK